MELIKSIIGWIRRWISPVYVVLLVASFMLWFITKLGDTYTTDHKVTVVIDNKEYNVDCTIKGKGTDLIHYTISSKRSRFTIPISDLTLDKPMVDNDGNSLVHITAESLKLALAQRMNNIEVVSVGSVPVIVEECKPAIVEQPQNDKPSAKSKNCEPKRVDVSEQAPSPTAVAMPEPMEIIEACDSLTSADII